MDGVRFARFRLLNVSYRKLSLANFFRFWVPPIIYAFLIFFLSSLSKPPLPIEIESNFLHYPEYALFSFLLLRAFHSNKSNDVVFSDILYTFSISILFGLLDEFHQAFVPERVPELKDLMRDTIGTSFGILIFLAFNFLYNKFKGKK